MSWPSSFEFSASLPNQTLLFVIVRLPVATYDDDAGMVTATATKDFELKLVRSPLAVTCAVIDG